MKKDGLALVDFYATWCPPCRAAAPVVGQWSLQYPSVSFAKVDVDQCRRIAQEQKITGMPTFKLFENGKKIDEVIGFDRTKIAAMLDRKAGPAPAATSKTA